MDFSLKAKVICWGIAIFCLEGFVSAPEIAAHEARRESARSRRLITLDLVQPHFYHLDTCFFPVDDRSALLLSGAFDAKEAASADQEDLSRNPRLRSLKRMRKILPAMAYASAERLCSIKPVER